MFDIFWTFPPTKRSFTTRECWLQGGWASSGYDSSQPGYGLLRSTNKDYSVPGIFSSLKLANIFQLVLRSWHNGRVRLKYSWSLESVFRMNDSQCELGQIWDIDEFDPPLVPPGPPWPPLVPSWFIIVQWRGGWPGRGNDRITRGCWGEGDVRRWS